MKIIRRYSISVGGIILVVLLCNVVSSLCFLYIASRDMEYDSNPRGIMEEIGGTLAERGGEYQISEEGLQILEQSVFVWAMALDAEGETVWEWQLPPEIPRSYTLQEVASFSRWYLEDYPVYVWRYGRLLLVFGSNPEQKFRYSVVMSRKMVEKFPLYVKMLLAVNLLLILVFILCFGYRFYRSLQPLAEGIEMLSAGEPLHLKEKGLAGELAGKLNLTSRVLERQGEKLRQRDQARTEWISGVSHDIRTPLALILGNADRLSESEALGEEERELAKTIRRQSMIIGQLIQDLNLTSKLAYEFQPLQKEQCSMAFILRECVADLYNKGLEQNYEITVTVTERAEQIKLYADAGLIARAMRNLLGNSIRHNPGGCRIEALLFCSGSRICCMIRDSGPGIPEQVVQDIEKPDSKVHILGLRLTAQIAKAHGGALLFEKKGSGGYDAKLVIAAE